MELFYSIKQRMVESDSRGTKAVVVGGLVTAAATGAYFMSKWFKSRRLKQALKAFEEQSIAENKIILHCIPIAYERFPHESPFVARIITFLELNKIPYIVDTTMAMHFYTQKMPWITYKNHHQPDSSLIIDYIQSHPDFKCQHVDQHLNGEQRAVSTAFKSMIDDGLTPVIRFRRLSLSENREVYMNITCSTLGLKPWQVKILAFYFEGYVKKMLWIQGLSFAKTVRCPI